MQRQTYLLKTGVALATYRWLPDGAGRPEAAVIIAHGYAEHAGRYDALAARLVGAGYAVYALDHRGHGHSEGERANVGVFREFVSDLARFTEHVREIHPNPPRFLLGHSMGGLVALQMVLEQPERVDGLLLSGAYLSNAAEVPRALLALSGPVSRLFPSLPVQSLDTDALSRDPAVVEAYRTDPLVYHGKVKARLGHEMLQAGAFVMERADSVRLPVLIMHGGADRLAAPEGSRELFERVGSKDKTLHIYDGYCHEIFNDVGKEKPVGDVLEWLGAHPHTDSHTE